jgi:OOP family OmpA-OmpF porin
MHLRLGTITLLASTALLAGCAGNGFQSQRAVDSASSASVTGDAYHRALYDGYVEHMKYEHDEMMNYTSAIAHARKAEQAARGETPTIAQPTDFGPQPADKVDELTQARAQLVAALDDNGAQLQPEAAGKAQAYYDCWVEQQHENFQPKDIAYCRDGFYNNLKIVTDSAVPTAGAPEVTALQADVLFEFDSSVVRDEFKPELDRIADVMIADTSTQFLVWGFTDTVGTEEYNQGLSERRADAVADYLESRGVTRDRLVIRGFGETNLAVQTPDETPEPRNRRVEIRRR